MRPRSLLFVTIAALALLVPLVAVPTSSADDTSHPRRRLRKQVMLLRAEVADLATRVSFATRSEGTPQPVPPYPWPAGNLCADPCATDSDGDGLGDCEDYCPCDPNTADDDGDGVMDCADPCPGDATQDCINPCKVDSDGDGITDCEDKCPWDPSPVLDADDDGIPDCYDYCPGDAANLCFEPCKIDRDGDGIPDCDDTCPWVGSADGNTEVCVPPPIAMH